MTIPGICRRFAPDFHDWELVPELVEGFLAWACAKCREVVVLGEGGEMYWLFEVDEEP